MHYRASQITYILLSLCFLLLGAPGVGIAQVYKSYDADGNVVFSDKPSDGGDEVEISKPNVSDTFVAPPPSETSSSPEPEPETEPEPGSEPEPIAEESADTNNDGRISRREKEEFREEQHRKAREAKKAAGVKESWE